VNTVCQVSSHSCISLTSADCPDVLGDYKNDNAVIFGAIFPTVITHPPDYFTALSDTGASIKAGLSMAVDDFASAKNPGKGLPPLPGKSEARPLVFVVCSDNALATSTASATTHLVSDLGVPAIIGTAFSTHTRTIVTTLQTLGKNDVLLMVPRSTDLAAADNGGLFTRLAPLDSVQGAALSALVGDREATIVSSDDAGTGGITVALVYKEDSYGNGVAAAVKSTLRFNGKDVPGNLAAGRFKELKYGNPDAPNYSPQFPSVTLGLVNAAPHAIIFVGTNEVVPGILATVEAGWKSTVPYRPRYFLSDGVVVKELWDYLANNDTSDSTRKRILGTIVTGTAARFSSFATNYAAKYPQQSAIVYGAAGAYDAAYMLAYGAAGIGDKPLTGGNLMDGFHLLAPGGGALQVGVGADDISSTFAKLVSGQAVNLDGASSPLDIDQGTHAASGVTTQVWCVPSVGGRAQQVILSGQTIDATNTVKGTFSAACGQ
jgi:ABC-type branched-subunit amino acid transport system substrate-binding protein